MYWNSDRTNRFFDKFVICAYRPNNEIRASYMMRAPKSKEIEIQAFFNEGVDDEDKLKQLLSYTIKESLCDETSNVVYFIEDDCELELKVALNLGFKKIEQYKCFKVVC